MIAASIVTPCGAQEAEQNTQAEEEAKGVGLAGIYVDPIDEDKPLRNPDLDTQFLAEDLPKSWQEWAMALDEEMLAYLNLDTNPDNLDVAAQRELIEKLRKRVLTMKKAIADPRYAPIRDRLISLAGPLDRHLQLSTAILDTFEDGVTPLSKETKQRAFEYLRESAQKLDSYLAHQEGGQEWKMTFGLQELLQRLGDMDTPAGDLEKHLEGILARFETRDDYTAEQLRLLRSNPFWQFRRAAAQVEAVLEWEKTPPGMQILRETAQDLAQSIIALEIHSLANNVQDMQLAWDRLDLLNPQMRTRFDFLNREYYNANLHTYTGEGVLGEAVYEQRTQTDPICEYSDTGALLTGTSTTTTEARLDLVPSPEEALMAVKVTGNVKTHVIAEKCSIRVYTQGYAEFSAEKYAHFDGFQFRADPAKIFVNATIIPYAAETPFSCLPGFGDCFERLVLNQAMAQRPDAEADMRQRIADEVVPELNREIGNALADANQDLDDQYQRLSRNNLYPIVMQTSTTETHLLSRTLIRDMVELGGGPAPVLFNHPTGVNYHVHESLLNNVADRMDVAGRTMTDDEFRAELERFFEDLTGRDFDFSESEEEPEREQVKFVFDKVSPLKFQIRDNEIRLTVRTGLIRPNADDIEPHDVTIPFQYEVTGDKILVKKGTLFANAVDPDDASVAKNLGIRQAIGDALPDGERSRYTTVNLREGRTLELRTEQIKALDGWLSVWLVPVQSTPAPAPMPNP